MPNALNITSTEQSASVKVMSSGIVKRATVMTRATGFFQKLRPQLAVETVDFHLGASRRFSFEPGDDVAVQSFASPELAASPNNSKSLRRSASLCSMSSRTPSRIPTPVRAPGAFARPRRERDESMSSLLTAIKRSDDSDSRASSVYSSPSLCHEDFLKASPGKDGDSMSEPRSRKNKHLLDHTNHPRGSGSHDGGSGGKCSSARGNLTDMSPSLQENSRPSN